jgi:hypothetical protein
MLIAAAVCPHPPLLVPEATGEFVFPQGGSGGMGPPGREGASTATGASQPGAGELGRLRAACRDAVAVLLAAAPDQLVVTGGAAQTTEYPADAGGSLAGFAVPFAIGSGSGLPLSLTIGKWLLAGAGTGTRIPPVAWWGIASGAAPGECLRLGEKLAALAPRVALLAMGDGPGRRARGVPGAADPGADRYDAQVTAALAAADPGALAALDPGQDEELFAAGRAAWQVLAGAAASGAGALAAGLRYAAAPFEVSYYVATWIQAH